MNMQAGGLNNYSQWVAELAALTGGGSYRFDKAMIDAAALPSAGVVAGSMRGFGGPQAFFAIECLVDEIADSLGVDAITLRRRNALQTGERTVTGAPLIQDMRLAEICEYASDLPLWRDRAAAKQARESPGRLYGVGFALANQAYGTGSDGVMAEVAINAEGRLTVRTNCIDMGNGSATSFALSTARHLGANAQTVEMGDVARFDALGLHADPTPPEAPWDDPHWTACYELSSSACMTAFHQVHAVEQAARILFEESLLPVACRIWGISPAAALPDTLWREGSLTAPGLPPLPLPAIARRVHGDNAIAAVMVHAYFQVTWVSAEFVVGDVARRRPLDGLSTRRAQEAGWTMHLRRHTTPPPPGADRYGRSVYAPSGALAAVEIDRRTGAVSVVEIWSFLDPGRIIQQHIVAGQSDGAVAMGIGYALLEELPLLGEGAGNGRWNLDRYNLARWADMPLDRMYLFQLSARRKPARALPRRSSAPSRQPSPMRWPMRPAIASASCPSPPTRS